MTSSDGRGPALPDSRFSAAAGERARAGASSWPRRLAELGRQAYLSPPPDERILGQVWQILNGSIASFASHHAAKSRVVCEDDIRDIAAEKSLEILRKIELGVWRVFERSDGEIAAFLSRVAKNGLLDLLRRRRRSVRWGELEKAEPDSPDAEWSVAAESPDPVAGNGLVSTHRSEFVKVIVFCVKQLTPRARTAWMLRIFAEMPTKEIAAHPDVHCQPGNVDAILHRTRKSLRRCIKKRGFEAQDLVPGTFTVLWQSFYVDVSDRRVKTTRRGDR